VSAAAKLKPTDQRFTPAWLLDLVKRSLGPIGFDPCTTRDNPAGASAWCHLPTYNGLDVDWAQQQEIGRGGCVWVNPPFSQLSRWVVRVVEASVSCTDIMLLTPVDPSTEWYSHLFQHADLAIQLHDRVKFVAPSDQTQLANVAMQPTMLWYFGSRVKAVVTTFEGRAHMFFPGVVR